MIPDFQVMMLPVLRILGENKSLKVKKLRQIIIEEFLISREEQKELIPSGTQPLFYNRLSWAISYLKNSGLVVVPQRGLYKITEEGIKLLEKNISEITTRFLKEQYLAFREWMKPRKNNISEDDSSGQPDDNLDNKTPDELIQSGYESIRRDLANELLETIKKNPPAFFENLVVDLLLKMGYGGSRREFAEVTKASHDGGIDGIIKEDKLGLDKIYIQAKRWTQNIQRPEIQKFAGALKQYGAKKGVFITTSGFSKGAIDSIDHFKDFTLVLIDGTELADLMIDYELGVSVKKMYKICKIDSDYFEDM